MKHLLLVLICGGILCSCTITKRHFGNGYHVEWKSRIRTAPESPENSKMEAPGTDEAPESTDSFIIDQVESIEQANAETKNVIEGKEAIKDQRVEEPPFQSKTYIQKEKQITTGESSITKEADESETEPKRRMHPLMWGVWGMWSIAIACMFFVTFYVEALIGVGLGFFIAMIFAIIAIRGLRKHPEKYRFKGLTYGFGIPAIVFGGIALAGFGVFLLMMFTY